MLDGFFPSILNVCELRKKSYLREPREVMPVGARRVNTLRLLKRRENALLRRVFNGYVALHAGWRAVSWLSSAVTPMRGLHCGELEAGARVDISFVARGNNEAYRRICASNTE